MKRILKHCGSLFRTTFPMAITAFLLDANLFCSLIFIGKYGPNYLGAATIGNMICNVSGYSLGIGMCSALDTLISQAYGAKAYHLIGLNCQRMIAILTICCIPAAILWSQTEYILTRILFMDKEISKLAGEWSTVLIAGLWPSLMFEVLRKYLQCQTVVWPVVISSSISIVVNITLGCYFMYVLKSGFYGCAVAYVLSQWALFISICVIIIIRKNREKSDRFGGYSKLNVLDYSDTIVESDVIDSVTIDDDESCVRDEVFSNSVPTTRDEDTGERSSSGTNKFPGHLPPSLREETVSDSPSSTSRTSALPSTMSSNETPSIVNSLEIEMNDDQFDKFNPASSSREDDWPAWSWAVLDDCGKVLRLGVPGAVSLFIEW